MQSFPILAHVDATKTVNCSTFQIRSVEDDYRMRIISLLESGIHENTCSSRMPKATFKPCCRLLSISTMFLASCKTKHVIQKMNPNYSIFPLEFSNWQSLHSERFSNVCFFAKKREKADLALKAVIDNSKHKICDEVHSK
jgi:hypothetical protein